MRPSYIRFIPLAVALTGAALCQPALARCADEQAPPAPVVHPAQTVPEGKAKAFGKEANPGEVFKETKGRPALRSRGVTVRTLHGREAGKPIASLAGAKGISRSQWTQMKEIPKTGLYLVDLDHVPPGLEEDLKTNGYQLAKDGTLTQHGKPVALFVHGETFHLKPERTAGAPGGLAGLAGAAGRSLLDFVDAAQSLFVSDAKAAAPFPWACGSWYFKWQYDGGFCRDYKAWSNAYAWGAGPGGGCADPKPLTRVEYISTYVAIGGHTGWDHHYNADQSHAYATWDIGCFWPAHGTASGYHYAYWRDGGAWMYRTWSW